MLQELKEFEKLLVSGGIATLMAFAVISLIFINQPGNT